MTTAGPTAAIGAGVSKAWKSCLRVANAPPKGLVGSFKDPLLKFYFYHYADPDDI